MTYICLKFLCSKDLKPAIQSLIGKFEKHRRMKGIIDKGSHIDSLLAYTATHWPSHLRDACYPTSDPIIQTVSNFYEVDTGEYNVWFPIFWKASRPYEDQPRMHPIHVAALLGHESVLNLILQSDKPYNINELDSADRTALIWASLLGHVQAVQVLLEKGADANSLGRGDSTASSITSRSRGGGAGTP